MEYSRWPFPARWGKPSPAEVPREVLHDEEAANAFLEGWVRSKILADQRAGRCVVPGRSPVTVAPGRRQGPLSGHEAKAYMEARRRPMTGREARALLRDRLAAEAHQRRMELLGKATSP